MRQHGKKGICITIIALSLVFLLISWILLISSTILPKKEYSSIEELHFAYKQELINSNDASHDFWIKDLVYYEQIDDILYVISTYSSSEDSEIIQDELFVYFVKENKQHKYELQTSLFGGWAEIKLNSSYSLGGNYYYFSNVEILGRKKSMCFLYKSIENKNKILFDGNQTTEVVIGNPFKVGERFTLCYGFSKPDSFMGNLLHPIERRHSCSYSS